MCWIFISLSDVLKRRWSGWRRRRRKSRQKYGTYCAFIRMPHTQCHQAQMKSVSFQRTASTYRPDDKIQRRWQQQRHLIHFDSFLQIFIHRYECVHISFFVYLRSAFVFSIHLTNSLTTNSWQWNIPKYCSHLLVFRWWNSYMQIWCLQAFTIYRWVYCDCDTAVWYAQKTISENHFWISQNTDQKITCIFQYTFSFIHSSQWFVILL